jgi:hypothetical protein
LQRGSDVEYAHGTGDVLNLLFTAVLESKIELVAYLIAHDAANADAAGLSKSLKAGCDIDPVPEDIPAIDDDVAEIDPNAQLNPLGVGRSGIAHGHLALDINRTAHRVDDAGKLDEHPVTGGFDDPAAVLLDLGIGQFASDSLQGS